MSLSPPAAMLDEAELVECTRPNGLGRALFEEMLGLVRATAIDSERIRKFVAKGENEFSTLRARFADGEISAAVQLSEAKAELATGLLLLRQTARLSPEDRKLIAPYLAGSFPAIDRLPHAKYRLTTDWVTRHETNWRRHFGGFAGRPNLRFLEIGSYEGRSACWWLENVLTHATASLTCVDPFVAHNVQEELFDFNVAASGGQSRVKKLKAFSFDALRRMPHQSFDFIYIDGSHFALDVAQDALLAWPLLKAGGSCLFDDYAIDQKYPEVGTVRWARRGVDAFLHIVAGFYEVIHQGYQLLIRRTL